MLGLNDPSVPLDAVRDGRRAVTWAAHYRGDFQEAGPQPVCSGVAHQDVVAAVAGQVVVAQPSEEAVIPVTAGDPIVPLAATPS